MKTQEILLASAVIAVVAGAGTALATRAFESAPARSEAGAKAERSPEAAAEDPGAAEATLRALEELRLANAALLDRVAVLEARLGEVASSRRPVEESAGAGSPEARDELAALAGQVAVDDDFVASVGRALDAIEAREDAERDQRRKEQQAERVEERVAELQQELGLNARQASDMRTALIAIDDKREAIFDEMREMEGDPRDMRDTFRTLRDEANASFKAILTPDQYETYRKNEDAEFSRRGDFGGGGAPEERRARRERTGERPGR